MEQTQTLQEKAQEQFEAVYESIAEMVEGLHSDDPAKLEEAEMRIGEDPLLAERTVGYKIELAAGGPAYWLKGDLDEHHEPESVQFYYQNWFTEPERVWLTSSQEEVLLEYASQFYFEPV